MSTQNTSTGSRWLYRPRSELLLAAILVLAATLRIYRLGAESFWFDEFITIQNSLPPALHWHSTTSLAIFGMAAVSHAEAVIRLPFALAGVGSVLFSYLLGKRLFDTTTGLIAALLLSVTPIHIRYSQEARYSSFVVLFALLSAYFFYNALSANRWRDWALFVLVAVIGIYDLPANFLPLASLAAFGVAVLGINLINTLRARRAARTTNTPDADFTPSLSGERSRWVRFVASMLVIGLLGLPMLIGAATEIDVADASAVPFVPPPQPSGELRVTPQELGLPSSAAQKLYQPSLPYFADLFGNYSVWGNYIGRGQVVSWVLFISGLAVMIWRRKWWQLGLFVAWFSIPFLILNVISFRSLRVGLPHHLLFLLPFYLLAIALSLAELGRQLLRLGASWQRTNAGPLSIRTVSRAVSIMVVLAGSLFLARWSTKAVPAYHNSYPKKEQWREATALIDKLHVQGDIILFNSGGTSWFFDWYSSSPSSELIRRPFPEGKRLVTPDDLQELPAVVGDSQRVWVVFSHDILDAQKSISDALSQLYTPVIDQQYLRIRVMLFEKKPVHTLSRFRSQAQANGQKDLTRPQTPGMLFKRGSYA